MKASSIFKISLFVITFLPGYWAFGQVDISGTMEYYIDTDPGVGLASPIAITSGATITESFILPTAALPEGFHTVYFRVLDVNGVWSMSESRSFYVSASNLTTQSNVVAVEYYIDTDPGYGGGISLPLTAATNVNLTPIIPTAVLPAGFHTIYIRALDSDGFWGESESRSFYVSASNLTTQANIVDVEYFIDTDPGYGNGTSLPVTAGTNININPIIPTNTLPAGFHVLYIRALDSDGVWSVIESRSFVLDAFSKGLITDIEYFFNTDPGYGSGSKLVINPPKDSIDSVVNIPTGALAVGPHTLGIRLITDNGVFGITDYYNFALCAGATAAFVGDVVCIGGTTTITDNSLNVLTGDVYSWDFDGDGLEDSTTPGNQSFTYPAPGIYTATLSIDRLGCIGVDTVLVSVETIPVANAGPDQSICVTNTVLEGSFLGPNEVGTWSVLSGSALIALATDSVSAISAISSNNVELIWTVTNSLAGCSDSDTVLISANLPITANSLTSTVDIGQVINIDVQSFAAINPGDLLATTITTAPLYGLATILADGTIDYEPDLDALASDSLLYRITNQCANFDENKVVFTVVNSPPVIDTVGVSVPPGATEVTVDLTTIISDPNGNIDFSSIIIITQPISGAIASIDASGILTIDYRGITFSGTDRIEVQVCDLLGACTIETITIPNVEVGGVNPPITVFNGVSPDGDGFNDFLEIENIEFYPENVVIILNRWGAQIAKYQGYNNQDVVFNDATLPSGTYYYHILPGVTEVNEVTGHFVLKID
jgi:gliding motility-associated-like protein